MWSWQSVVQSCIFRLSFGLRNGLDTPFLGSNEESVCAFDTKYPPVSPFAWTFLSCHDTQYRNKFLRSYASASNSLPAFVSLRSVQTCSNYLDLNHPGLTNHAVALYFYVLLLATQSYWDCQNSFFSLRASVCVEHKGSKRFIAGPSIISPGDHSARPPGLPYAITKSVDSDSIEWIISLLFSHFGVVTQCSNG